VGKPLAYPKSNLQLAVLSYFAAAAMTNFGIGSRYVGKAAPAIPQLPRKLPQITVISNTPLEGLGLPLNQIPANVQTADSKDMESQQTLGIADYLNNNFSGVSVSDSADNPFQLDINYHGFTASPLLGTPEGLSIYLDGVRVNESFGDTVNWDVDPAKCGFHDHPPVGLESGCSVSIHWEAHSRCARRADTIIPAPSSRPTAAHSGGAPSRDETGGRVRQFRLLLRAGTYFDENVGARTRRAGSIRPSQGRMAERRRPDFDLQATPTPIPASTATGAAPHEHAGLRRESSYTTGLHRESHELCQSHRHAVPHRQAPAVGQPSFLPAPRHERVNGNTNDSYLAGDYMAGPPLDCTCAGHEPRLAHLLHAGTECELAPRAKHQGRGVALQLTRFRGSVRLVEPVTLGADLTDTDDSFLAGATNTAH